MENKSNGAIDTKVRHFLDKDRFFNLILIQFELGNSWLWILKYALNLTPNISSLSTAVFLFLSKKNHLWNKNHKIRVWQDKHSFFNKKFLQFEIQLSFRTEKISRGSQELCRREHFSPRPSPFMSFHCMKGPVVKKQFVTGQSWWLKMNLQYR